MLSSIHPLGERARNNNWWLTIGSFTMAAIAAGALVGAALGFAGQVLASSLSNDARLVLLAGVALVAGSLDWRSITPSGPTRQVNEHWIGHYRGWVYGGAFGGQLGSGVSTYIVTWGVYATLLAELLIGSWSAAAIVGALFGFGRSLAPLMAGWIDRPSRLSAFHSRMSLFRPVMRSSGALAMAGAGVVVIIGVAF